MFDLSEYRKEKWKSDPEYRRRQAERDQRRRERLRVKKVKGNFSRYVKALDQMGDSLTVKDLAKVVRRSEACVQHWLAAHILPGYSTRSGRARLFDQAYVFAICRALYTTELQNARGSAAIFKKEIRKLVGQEHLEVRHDQVEKSKG